MVDPHKTIHATTCFLQYDSVYSRNSIEVIRKIPFRIFFQKKNLNWFNSYGETIEQTVERTLGTLCGETATRRSTYKSSRCKILFSSLHKSCIL